MTTISKADYICELQAALESQFPGINKTKVEAILTAQCNILHTNLSKGLGVTVVPGQIKVLREVVQAKSAREWFNPSTRVKETLPAKPAHYTVKVKVLKHLMDHVRSKRV